MRVGVKQGIMQGITAGTTNCVFLCSYALAFWYGSTRVRAGKYNGASHCLCFQKDLLQALCETRQGKGRLTCRARPAYLIFRSGCTCMYKILH